MLKYALDLIIRPYRAIHSSDNGQNTICHSYLAFYPTVNWFQNKSYEFMGTPSKSQISSGYTVEISNFRLRRFLNPENSDHARGTRIRKEEFMVNF